MNDANGYAVYFFPQALEALGDAIKPYLHGETATAHVVCNEIDTSGSLIEMTMRGSTNEGKPAVLELMVPVSMVRMIVSSQTDGMFGFGPRLPMEAGLPPIGPTAEPASAHPSALPEGGADVADSPAVTEPAALRADVAAKPSP